MKDGNDRSLRRDRVDASFSRFPMPIALLLNISLDYKSRLQEASMPLLLHRVSTLFPTSRIPESIPPFLRNFFRHHAFDSCTVR
jgi:hypothetical protein